MVLQQHQQTPGQHIGTDIQPGLEGNPFTLNRPAPGDIGVVTEQRPGHLDRLRAYPPLVKHAAVLQVKQTRMTEQICRYPWAAIASEVIRRGYQHPPIPRRQR
ncbi:hypothetical protein D3C85_1275390 [compost metagenome]